MRDGPNGPPQSSQRVQTHRVASPSSTSSLRSPSPSQGVAQDLCTKAEGGRNKPKGEAGGRSANRSNGRAARTGQEEVRAAIRQQREQETTWEELRAAAAVQDSEARADLTVPVRKLAGCTLFITGASRGIGKAIALKAAKDGANIVIAAKTAEPHPTLPGTIYTAAAEIEAAGGKALPCVVNVREEQQIINAVEKAVKTFGGIDILVNNASAISLTGTLETETKKVNLMMDVNVRGTYLTSKTCLPHLRKSRNPHILNLSPPMNLNPMWFKNHCAYTISKYGMSMCVLGMAEEFRGEVAVNALWPKTAIHTAAMDMLGGAGIEKQCRKTDILADAAYCILTKPKSFTGNFIIDEVLLREEGVKDFDVYAIAPGHPLMPDFFLDVATDMTAVKQEGYGASQAFKEERKLSGSQREGPDGATVNTEPAPAKPLSPVAETFRVIQGAMSEEYVRSTQGVFQFELSGDDGGTWYIDLKTKGGSAGFGKPPVTADVVMSMSSADFVKMFTGKLKPTLAFMSGKLRIKGNMALAIKLEKMLTQLNSKL
ncbi:PREDICTED: hydroxysteroid dehydrogenase-like protein 2 [Haliaeetus leucocephalus]|nr:PREDICTED: hydroxysteroid dehydrogenase-like protein 2 [Haliaeetus leucocephalus]